MKKAIIGLLLFFLFVFNVNAEEIKDFDSQININKDGTVDIKETITYDFGNLFKHGIFRTIPYIKTNKDGKKFQLVFDNFSVTDESGMPYQYSQTTENNDLRLKIGDPNRTISGSHTYIIDYKVSGALTYFSDHDELYWNITGNDWEVPIVRATSKIILPPQIKEDEINGKCYIGESGSTETDCEIQKNKNSIKFDTVNELSITEGLTVVVGFPIDVINVLEPKPYTEFKDSLMGKFVMLLMSLIGLIWYGLLPFYIIYRWFKTGRDPKGTVGVTTAWFDPPKTPDNKRSLTPGEVGTLGDETVDLKDISATIIDLARRGYLKIEERKKNDFYLINLGNSKPLFSFERLLIDKFFKNKTEIRLKDEHLYEEVEEIKKNLYQIVVDEKLFSQNPETTRTIYYVIALVALFTGNLPLAFVSFIFGRAMPKKTVEGVNAFNISKSLKNFLTSQERQMKFQADKQMMFEKLLPYAVVFGVEKVWAKRFENLNLRQPDWYQGYLSGHFNSYIFVNSLSSSMGSFRSAATPTRSSSGFSSGFSGGSSGGGGGGGGGGSW
ncbi:DUF2207 domain-containing protein [Candidatus Roizmanbacteria bacterium]|nr:DUF2207 domain-containing protein [Candidatus Roizmanbacteria bacterium]